MDTSAPAYPLPISRFLQAAEQACLEDNAETCHNLASRLAGALTCYLGAVAVAQYSQALYTEQIEPDPTLNRSLRSLRRLLPGQWLTWAKCGLQATPGGPVTGLAEWFAARQGGSAAEAYEQLRQIMVERLGYTGEYGPRTQVSPRVFLEMVDQYRIRASKAVEAGQEVRAAEGRAILEGTRELLVSGGVLREYQLYAPQQRQMLMGLNAVTPMPPLTSPTEAATLLLYPPGEMPDYTKRPNLQAERVPLFPLDPLLIYINCRECDLYRVAALQGVSNDVPTYLGLDPECGHILNPARVESME